MEKAKTLDILMYSPRLVTNPREEHFLANSIYFLVYGESISIKTLDFGPWLNQWYPNKQLA